MIALGNNAHIFARPHRRDELTRCFELAFAGCSVRTVAFPGIDEPMLVVSFPGGGHLSIEFTDDAPDDEQPPRLGAWLELRTDDPAAAWRAATRLSSTPRVAASGPARDVERFRSPKRPAGFADVDRGGATSRSARSGRHRIRSVPLAQLFRSRMDSAIFSSPAGDVEHLRRRISWVYDGVDPVGVVGADGVIVDVNDGWERLLGYQPRDVVGRPVTDFAPPGLASVLSVRLADCLKSAAGRLSAVPVRHRDGRDLLLELSYRRTDMGGRVVVVGGWPW
jgi:PAS domain S-box-containing protein